MNKTEKRKMIEKAISKLKHKDIIRDIAWEYWRYNIITEKINEVQNITLKDLDDIIAHTLRISHNKGK